MTSVGLDSPASFRARALEIGMTDGLYNLFRDNGVQTYGAFAFICPYTAGQAEEQVLIDASEAIIHRPLSTRENSTIGDCSLKAILWPLQI